MKYRRGYKYQLARAEKFQTRLRPNGSIETDFITLSKDGQLIGKLGYAWDGATWAIDTPIFIAESCRHDMLYQLARLGLIPDENWSEYDEELKRGIILRSKRHRWYYKQLLWRIRLIWIMAALKLAQGAAARPCAKRKVYEVL